MSCSTFHFDNHDPHMRRHYIRFVMLWQMWSLQKSVLRGGGISKCPPNPYLSLSTPLQPTPHPPTSRVELEITKILISCFCCKILIPQSVFSTSDQSELKDFPARIFSICPIYEMSSFQKTSPIKSVGSSLTSFAYFLRIHSQELCVSGTLDISTSPQNNNNEDCRFSQSESFNLLVRCE